jgi:hypothetical protein
MQDKESSFSRFQEYVIIVGDITHASEANRHFVFTVAPKGKNYVCEPA